MKTGNQSLFGDWLNIMTSFDRYSSSIPKEFSEESFVSDPKKVDEYFSINNPFEIYKGVTYSKYLEGISKGTYKPCTKKTFEEYLKVYTDGQFGERENRLHRLERDEDWVDCGLDVFELKEDGIYEWVDPQECSIRAYYNDPEEIDDFIAGNIMEESWRICDNLGIEWKSYSSFIDSTLN